MGLLNCGERRTQPLADKQLQSATASEQQQGHIKQRIATGFTRAASRYDQQAQVQRDIAREALALFAEDCASGAQAGGTLLDLGCGTGRETAMLRPFATRIYALDLSFGMLEYAQQQAPTANSNTLDTAANGDGGEVHKTVWVHGDFDQLPLLDNSVDRAFSSMALQWSGQPRRFFNELYRVLQPAGRAVLAIMAAGSLAELRQSWRALDRQPHINQLHSAELYRDWAGSAGFAVHLQQRSFTSLHPDVRSVMHSIKDVGAGVRTHTGANSPLTRAQLTRMQAVYIQQFGVNGKLPLTYQVGFLQLIK